MGPRGPCTRAASPSAAAQNTSTEVTVIWVRKALGTSG